MRTDPENAELDLMPIRVPGNTRIPQALNGRARLPIVEDDGLVCDAAVPPDAPQSVPQSLRGGRDVIQQPKIPKVGLLRERKAETIILERLGRGLEEGNLRLGADTLLHILDLCPRYPRPRHKRLELDASPLKSRGG